jgi:uncharacterized protein (DUF488 family)
MKIYTIGFTKKSARAFFTKLRESGATRVVDVRLNNVSQLAAFAKKDDLQFFLKEICHMDYVHMPILAPTADILDAYKKHKGDWGVYERAFMGLMATREIESRIQQSQLDNGCLLCSEDTPERCHRRLVAEYLQARWPDVVVEHLV